MDRRHFLTRTALGAGALTVGCGGGSGADLSSASSSATPTPTPAPTPTPTPTPTPGFLGLTVFDVNIAKMVCFDEWDHGGEAYERFQRLTILTGSTATLGFYAKDWVANTFSALAASEYQLLVDGVPRATATVLTGAKRGSFTLDLTPLTEGWHKIHIVAHPSESPVPHFVYINRTGKAATTAPAWSGSFELTHGRTKYSYVEQLPPTLSPIVPAIKVREYPVFSAALAPTQLFRQDLAPVRPQNILRPNRNKAGIVSTCNEQAYFYSSLITKFPRQPLLDGPRGMGCITMATHIQVNRTGGAYVCDPWRLTKVLPDGTIKTLAGYRHKGMGSYYDGTQDVELVGDWSSIPVARRGFHELWGMSWDARTLATNESAAPIDGEKPHITGPACFITDSQNNRVIKLQFNPADRLDPVVSEFIVGLADPWDVIFDNGVLYVSERKANRIAVFNADTGAYLRTLVSGQALASVSFDRRPERNSGVTLEQVRAEPCVLPEGLALQDGWLYFGSKVMQQVKRVNVTTLAVEVVCTPYIDGNSKFVKIAISDGSFGPRGTVFTATWSNNDFGYPEAFLPGGAKWNYYKFTAQPIDSGRGGNWQTLSYTSAMGIGMGRMHCGSAGEGLVTISQALTTDPVIDTAKYRTGRTQYLDRGYHFLHGDCGNGYYGYALPWGASSEIDYYLQVNGHSPA